uniref:Ribonuclease P protein subunit p29 n=1 Tax=Panagrolaimus sp. JU765 TaxID=591449 RepID=A0AC34QUT7_9BILA
MNKAEADQPSAPKRFFWFDTRIKKLKSGPKSTAPENIIKRAGGLKKEEFKYEKLLPLYELWCGYFKEILASAPHPDERLLKTDFHGCILFVVDSPNPSQIGVYGICLHESKSTFQLLSVKDKVLIIQKEHTTFQFIFDGRVFTLFGSALCQRSFARGRKFKGKLTLPFFLPNS